MLPVSLKMTFIFSFLFIFFSCNTVDKKQKSEESDSTTATLKRNGYVSSDSSTYAERPVDSTFAEPISGMIEDLNSQKIYIKVFPSRELKSCGIILEEIKNGKRSKETKQAIAAVLNIERDFSCNLLLEVYDYKNNLLGSGTAKIKGLMGDRKTVTFPFTEKTEFQQIDYCTLGIGE